MQYFSSDWHLSHKNILKYDIRKFLTVDDMNHTIISNVVGQLKHGDDLFYLGDFCLSSMNEAEGFLKSLVYTGANLYFIKGNHDKKDMIKLYSRYGTYLGEQKKIKISDNDIKGGVREIILNHYAMRVWDKSHHDSWHLYGHSHDSLEREEWGKSMDCGIMSAVRILGEYRAFSYNEIKKILNKRETKFIDHHVRETNS